MRLREEFTGKDKKAVLAYKGAREKGKFKKRLEVQTEISDAQSVRKMLAAIRYAEVLVYEKKRQLWVYGGCEICLDELPFLGKFVEIEGDSEKRIAKVQKELGLSDLPHTKESYATLMERELRGLKQEKEGSFFKGLKALMKPQDGYIAYIINPKAGSGGRKKCEQRFRDYLVGKSLRFA